MSREQNKRNAIVGGATAAGMGAGAGLGYVAGDKRAKSATTSAYNRVAGTKLSYDDVNAKFKELGPLIEEKHQLGLRRYKRSGMIAGATIGGTLALEGARHFTRKKEVKKNSRLSAFGVEH